MCVCIDVGIYVICINVCIHVGVYVFINMCMYLGLCRLVCIHVDMWAYVCTFVRLSSRRCWNMTNRSKRYAMIVWSPWQRFFAKPWSSVWSWSNHDGSVWSWSNRGGSVWSWSNPDHPHYCDRSMIIRMIMIKPWSPHDSDRTMIFDMVMTKPWSCIWSWSV